MALPLGVLAWRSDSGVYVTLRHHPEAEGSLRLVSLRVNTTASAKWGVRNFRNYADYTHTRNFCVIFFA